jgi:hypothetical protein
LKVRFGQKWSPVKFRFAPLADITAKAGLNLANAATRHGEGLPLPWPFPWFTPQLEAMQ